MSLSQALNQFAQNLGRYLGLFALVGICSYFGIEHHLDSKANKLSQGNEEDRRDADAQVEAA